MSNINIKDVENYIKELKDNLEFAKDNDFSEELILHIEKQIIKFENKLEEIKESEEK